jgi:hypothetical protein
MRKLRTTFMAELLSGFQRIFSTSESYTLVLIGELNRANTKWQVWVAAVTHNQQSRLERKGDAFRWTETWNITEILNCSTH